MTETASGYWRLRVEHARKQGDADGFQRGWHAALTRIREGDAIEELSTPVPNPTETGQLAALAAQIAPIVQEMRAARNEIKGYPIPALELERWADQLTELVQQLGGPACEHH